MIDQQGGPYGPLGVWTGSIFGPMWTYLWRAAMLTTSLLILWRIW